MPATSGFSFRSGDKKGDGAAAAANGGRQQQRRDPYEVLCVPRNSTDQEIKSAYRRMALK
ncbi:chaperone protein dnaJ 16-like [Iris pallida]|nr:chaperone protein dnaJ 16-like [Iris pallida]